MPTIFSRVSSSQPSAPSTAIIGPPPLPLPRSGPAQAGRSASEERPKHRRKTSVVRKLTGWPGRSSRPASSISPFCNRLLTLDEESTPRACSMKARETG